MNGRLVIPIENKTLNNGENDLCIYQKQGEELSKKEQIMRGMFSQLKDLPKQETKIIMDVNDYFYNDDEDAEKDDESKEIANEQEHA
jgi:hypothetical protein